VHVFSANPPSSQGAALTVLPRGVGIGGTRLLRFCITGGWSSVGTSRANPSAEIALGTQLAAVISQVRPGFRHRYDHRCVLLPTPADALASQLHGDPAWEGVMLLPLADPTTSELAFTFLVRGRKHADLVWPLLEAHREAVEQGVRAIPVVELARDNPCDQSYSEYEPDSAELMKLKEVHVTLWDPALPIVGWVPDTDNAGAAP